MSQPDGRQFDRYAGSYTEMHRVNIRASGEEPSYFSCYKARYMAAWLGRQKAAMPLDVLDFGCGVGNSIPHLRDAFPSARLQGVDPSGESIQLAAATHTGIAAFRLNTAEGLPGEDHSFDLVQAACVFHHIKPDERDHWLNEIRRVLRPGGDVFMFEHNVLNPLTLKAVRDCPFDEDAVLLPRSELIKRVRTAGFTGVKARYIVFFPAALGFLRPLEPWLGFVPLGAQYVVHAVA